MGTTYKSLGDPFISGNEEPTLSNTLLLSKTLISKGQEPFYYPETSRPLPHC